MSLSLAEWQVLKNKFPLTDYTWNPKKIQKIIKDDIKVISYN